MLLLILKKIFHFFNFLSLFFFYEFLFFIFSCSGMFRNVPECSGMFRHVPECSMFQVLSMAASSNICKPEDGWFGQPKYCYKKQYTLF